MMSRPSVGLLGVIWLCTLVSWIEGDVAEPTPEDRKPFTVKYFTSNPGIYYEPLQDVQLVRKEWQIITSIDLTRFHRQIDKVTGPHHNTLLENCKTLISEEECKEILKLESIATIKRQIIQLNRHLDDLFSSPQTKPIGIRRRRIPPFSFVGSLSRSLFGLMDYNDYKHIAKELDILYQSQKEITTIMNNSTHIIRSKIEDINSYLNQTNYNIAALKTTTQELLNRINHDNHSIRVIEYTLRLIRAGLEVESALRKMLEITENIVEAVNDAKHGRITHTLATPEQLHDIAARIKTVHPDLEFPIPTGVTDYAALSKVSTIGVAHAKGKLLAIITLPLLGRETYQLYRLHPCKRPQIVGNRSLAAHITPEKPYLIVANDRQHYALLDQDNLKSCAPLGSRIACVQRFAIINSILRPTCEVTLLLLPSIETFHSCDIKITQSQGTEWELLESGHQWLYTTNEPERGEVICSQRLVGTVNISGTGLISLSPDCKLQTASEQISYAGVLQTSETEIHLPPINLSLVVLAPELEEGPESLNELKSIRIDPLISKKDHAKIELQLDEAQRRLEQIGQRHQEIYHHRLLTYGSLGSLCMMALGGIGYVLLRWKGVWAMLRCVCGNPCSGRKKLMEGRRSSPARTEERIRSNSLPVIYSTIQDQPRTADPRKVESPMTSRSRPVTLIE